MRVGVGRGFVSRFLRYSLMLAVGVVVAVVLACSGMGETPAPVESVPAAAPTQTAAAAPTPTETPEPTAAPTSSQPEPTAAPTPSQPAATAAPTPAETPRSTPVVTPSRPEPTAVATPTQPVSRETAAPTSRTGTDYDSSENMYRLFSGRDHNPADSLEAIALAIDNNDKSMVPLMIEMLRFFEDYVPRIESRKALIAITGREVEGNEGLWRNWMEWLVKNADEYQPPAGYLEWKIVLMSLIDPRFGEFLAPAAEGSRINVFEIAWGGVRPDGIPDLQNASVVSAQEQDYLQPSDRVFGVSINGEHRAYPLRIVNAHEMANDVLGGEPIALAY